MLPITFMVADGHGRSRPTNINVGHKRGFGKLKLFVTNLIVMILLTLGYK